MRVLFDFPDRTGFYAVTSVISILARLAETTPGSLDINIEIIDEDGLTAFNIPLSCFRSTASRCARLPVSKPETTKTWSQVRSLRPGGVKALFAQLRSAGIRAGILTG
jgi:hypothetical protein